MKRKNYVLLPAAGRRMQLFHIIFTEPGVHLLGHPCIYEYEHKQVGILPFSVEIMQTASVAFLLIPTHF